MSKPKTQRSLEQPDLSAPLEVPPGPWVRCIPTREHGVEGYIVDRLDVVDGRFQVTRIHGPEIRPVAQMQLIYAAMGDA